MIIKRNPIFRRIAWVGLALSLLATMPFAAAQDEGGGSSDKQQQFQLSEKVSESLQKMKPLQDAKNYPAMLDLVNQLLSGVKPESYDAAYLLDMKARIYLTMEQYNNAIEPWEQVLALSRKYGYKDAKSQLDITKYLAQLIFSQATNIKDDRERQQQLISRSAGYLKEYLRQSTKTEPEVEMLYAQILFYQATADSAHVSQPLLAEARSIVEKGMLGTIKPKEGFYLLLLAILQQQGDSVHAAEIMELLLKQYPQKKDVWPMLFGTYVNLAGSVKSEAPEGTVSREQREYYVRAINTLERAQSLGFMNTPRDNYNLFTLYLNAGEINMATDILYNGMKSGKIESTEQNWRILGAYYQQVNKDLQAISALKEATQLFPKDGSLEFQIGQIYQGLDRTKEAHDAYARAVAKGNLGEKPHQAWLFLAYTSLELGDYDGAMKAINHAASLPSGAKDPQVKSVRQGIELTIQERENAKQAAQNKK